MRDDLVNKYNDQYLSMIEHLAKDLKMNFNIVQLKKTNYSRLRSTNMLERLNSEIRRREKIVRIFLKAKSAFSLIGVAPIDIHAELTSSSRQYISFTEETKKWINN